MISDQQLDQGDVRAKRALLMQSLHERPLLVPITGVNEKVKVWDALKKLAQYL